MAMSPGATRVAVINRAFATQIFPNEEPIGKRFGLGSVEHRADYQIVGIVDDPRFRNPRMPANPMFFVPLMQGSDADWSNVTFSRSNMVGSIQLQISGNPSDLVSRLRQATSGVDSHITLLRVKTFRDELGDLVGREFLLTRLAEGFGALALLLAAVGLYGVTSYAVARRRSEIGIRGALGANRSNIVGLIVRRALGQVAIGIILGLPAAYVAGRLLANQLWYVQPFDPLIIGSGAAILLAAAAIASLIPALRASSINPAIALRIE
jgi:ABC-type antimicrobial peptide transport system permease subunit